MAAHIEYFKAEDGYKFVSTFRYLVVDAPPGIYSLMPGVDIVVGDELKKKYLTPELLSAAGLIEFHHLESANHLLVGETPADFFNDLPLTLVLTMWLGWVDWLIQDSWLIKDNAIICEVAYCQKIVDGSVQWANNGLYSKMFTAGGVPDKEVKFDTSDLERWNEVCDTVRDLIFSNKSVMGGSISDKSYSRFARFYHFVDTSRRTAYEAVKIAHCCTALESLFSTDTVELSHRLSERVAFLFAKHGDDAEAIYQIVKDCYAIRSSVTHGSPVPSKFATSLVSQSEKLQNIMRRLVFIIIGDSELLRVLNGKNDGIEAYFRKLIFSSHKVV
jgi:hypothetical protein